MEPYKISLDLKRNYYQVLVMKAEDVNSRKIIITITDNGKPYDISNYSVRFKWHKPDHKIVFDSCTVNKDGTFTIACTEQMLIVGGIAEVEVIIYNEAVDFSDEDDSDEYVVSTMKFNVSIEDSVVGNKDIESSNEFGLLNKLLYEANGLFDTLKEHITDYLNPHKVTKSQVGLGNVPNVATNDQTPTYTESSTLEELKSGEKLFVAFGKIAKAVSILISHIATKATSSMFGHVRLSDSSTITDSVGLALAATEKNASIDGTLANQISELDVKKAPVDSPILTGIPKAPTASAGTNTTQIATTSFTQTAVSNHNISTTAHPDIRDLITGLTNRLNALADSNDTTLDQLSEIVAYIKSNRTLIENVTTNKVNTSDIIDNLTSIASNKPLSANQGKVLKELIDTLTATTSNKVDKVNGKGLSTNDYTTAEKNKLNGIATGAEVNQNAFSNVVVGSTTVAADSKTDTLTLVAGSNVTITPDASNDKITISSSHPVVSKSTDSTSTASPSAGGTFTAVDSVTRDGSGHVTKVNTKTVTLPSTSITVDNALSSTSTNPVQNKVVNSALITHTHDARYYTESEVNTLLSAKQNASTAITASNIGSQSVNYANSAGSANAVAWENVSGKPTAYAPSAHTHDDRYYTKSEMNTQLNGRIPTTASCNKNWYWSGQIGQPPWVWGGSDGTNMYVYNPSNFSVAYANRSAVSDVANEAVIAQSAACAVRLRSNPNSTGHQYSCVLTNQGNFRADEQFAGSIGCGTSSVRWKSVYANGGSITTSDFNYKKDIKPLTEQHMRFFMLLTPVSYLFTYGESGRTHVGFISQDVEEAMKEVGLTDLDFAGFCRDLNLKTHTDEEGNEVNEPILDKNGNETYIYSLRYEEFIALITYALQRTISRMDDWEERLESLEKSLN